MTWTPYDPFETAANPRARLRHLPARPLAVALLAALAFVAGLLFLISRAQKTGVPPVAGLASPDFPVALLTQIEQPEGGSWLLPSAAATVDGATFVLDAGNNRVLKLDGDGRLLAVLDKKADPRLDLRQPMAIASDGQSLFIASSLSGQIFVLDKAGRLDHVIDLPADAVGRTPRPIGIAATTDGRLVVSDANTHRVLFMDREARVLRSLGAGARSNGPAGFNVPAGIALDGDGNVYVVDTLNWRVVKLSPEGDYLREYGHMGEAAGGLSRPKGVAVDALGRVFISDGVLAAIQVFGPEGVYLGVIGRRAPADPASGSIFQAPAALAVSGDILQVTDRFAGLINLRIPAFLPGDLP